MQKSERQLRREIPLETLAPPSVPEPSLAVTQPHVAPAQEVKAKTKRVLSKTALKRSREAKEKGIERSQMLEKRRGSVDGKKDQKKKAKILWD